MLNVYHCPVCDKYFEIMSMDLIWEYCEKPLTDQSIEDRKCLICLLGKTGGGE